MLLPLVSLLSLCHAPLRTAAYTTLSQEALPGIYSRKEPRGSLGCALSAQINSGSCTWFHSDKQAIITSLSWSTKRAYSSCGQVSIVQKILQVPKYRKPVYLLRNQTQAPRAVMIVHRRAMDTCPGKTGAPPLRITPNLNKAVRALSLSWARN